jgi:hypothetical protein
MTATAARDQWMRDRGGTRGRDKTGTEHAGLWGVSWPNIGRDYVKSQFFENAA